MIARGGNVVLDEQEAHCFLRLLEEVHEHLDHMHALTPQEIAKLKGMCYSMQDHGIGGHANDNTPLFRGEQQIAA